MMYLQQNGVQASHTMLTTNTPSVYTCKIPPKLPTVLAKHGLSQIMTPYTKSINMLNKVYSMSTKHHNTSLSTQITWCNEPTA